MVWHVDDEEQKTKKRRIKQWPLSKHVRTSKTTAGASRDCTCISGPRWRERKRGVAARPECRLRTSGVWNNKYLGRCYIYIYIYAERCRRGEAFHLSGHAEISVPEAATKRGARNSYFTRTKLLLRGCKLQRCCSRLLALALLTLACICTVGCKTV